MYNPNKYVDIRQELTDHENILVDLVAAETTDLKLSIQGNMIRARNLLKHSPRNMTEDNLTASASILDEIVDKVTDATERTDTTFPRDVVYANILAIAEISKELKEDALDLGDKPQKRMHSNVFDPTLSYDL